jgi:hypothetical protein
MMIFLRRFYRLCADSYDYAYADPDVPRSGPDCKFHGKRLIKPVRIENGFLLGAYSMVLVGSPSAQTPLSAPAW